MSLRQLNIDPFSNIVDVQQIILLFDIPVLYSQATDQEYGPIMFEFNYVTQYIDKILYYTVSFISVTNSI